MTTITGPSISLAEAVDALDRTVPHSDVYSRSEQQQTCDQVLLAFLTRFDRDRQQTRRLITKYLPRVLHVQWHQVTIDRSFRLVHELCRLVPDFEVHSRLLTKKIELGLVRDLDMHLKPLRRKLTGEEAILLLRQLIKRASNGDEGNVIEFARAHNISDEVVREITQTERRSSELAELAYDGILLPQP